MINLPQPPQTPCLIGVNKGHMGPNGPHVNRTITISIFLARKMIFVRGYMTHMLIINMYFLCLIYKTCI